jgi:hemoglobin
VFDPRPSLYLRLGGYDALAAFVDDLLLRATSDPQIGVYWKGTSRDSLRRARQLALDFLCASMGGPAIYVGRGMKTLHQGMGISDADWEILMQHSRKTLDDLGIAEPEGKEVLSFLEGLKADIVEARRVQAGK